MDKLRIKSVKDASPRAPSSGPGPAALSAAVSPSAVSLQRRVGNQGMGRIIQAKLKIGEPNDKYEREADRIAGRIMEMTPPAAPDEKPGPDARLDGPVVQRKCAACEEEEQRIQLKPLNRNSRSDHSDNASVNAAIKQGQALTGAEQQFFGPRFGVDLGHVRLHHGPDANRSAAGLGARAYTFGHHIVFNRGEYRHDSPATRVLLAHELTHVIQQSKQGGATLIQRTTTRGAGGCGPLRVVDEDLDGARAAGRTAHTQIQTFLLRSAIANELEIPRATKRYMASTGCQPETRHEGRADLWKPGSVIGIAEIKPFGFATSTGVAREEADHYILRSRQSVDRTLSSGSGPDSCGHQPAGADDAAFARRIGMSGGLAGRKRFTRLSGILPAATTIGSFDGDRSRTLKAKLTEPGSVGYWCTGGLSNSYPCDATGRETDDYIDSVLYQAQDALDDFIRDNVEARLDQVIDSFDMRELLRMGKRYFWPMLRDALRRQLGPQAGVLIPDDISTDELADVLANQLGPEARTVIQTILREFKSRLLNELRLLLRGMLRDLIREALVALCVGVPVVTLATLLDKLRELFGRQVRILIPVAVNLVLARIAVAIAQAIIDAIAAIGNFILRLLAVVGMVLAGLAALILAVVTLLAAIDPVPGDEIVAGAGAYAFAQLAAVLFLFVITGAMSSEEGGGGGDGGGA